MSIVHYNGIVLPYAQATSFRKEAIPDELSKTDWYLSRYEITVQCMINTNFINLIDPSLTNDGPGQFSTNPANIMAAIYTKLMTKRKTLAYIVDGNNLIPLTQQGYNGECDAKNGPEPKSCNYFNLTSETFVLVYTIVAHYWENNEIAPGQSQLVVENKPSNPVLSNKWTESIDIDQYGMTIRTRTGEFVIRSDNSQQKTPDFYVPFMALLGIPNGFMRQRSKYTITPDGLKLKYEIVDKEWFKTPPIPSYYAEGVYVEKSSPSDAMRTGHCRVMLRGGKNPNRPYTQTDLLFTVMAVVGRKLAQAGQTAAVFFGNDGYILLSAEIKINMYQNEVGCEMSVMLPRARYVLTNGIAGDNRTQPNFETTNNRLCRTPLYDTGIEGAGSTTPIEQKGSANLLIQAAAYYDPNIVQTIVDPTTGNLTTGNQPGEG